VTVAKHWGYAGFYYNGTNLVSNTTLHPHAWGVAQGLLGTSVVSTSNYYDRYNTAYHGTGHANNFATFKSGVPTPWATIGSSFQDYLSSTVHYSGGWW
jgi:hypothetical protein